MRLPKKLLVLSKAFRAISTTLPRDSVLPGIQPETARPSSASDMDCFTTILSLRLHLTLSLRMADAPCSFFPHEADCPLAGLPCKIVRSPAAHAQYAPLILSEDPFSRECFTY